VDVKGGEMIHINLKKPPIVMDAISLDKNPMPKVRVFHYGRKAMSFFLTAGRDNHLIFAVLARPRHRRREDG